jgi:hypothetical protein
VRLRIEFGAAQGRGEAPNQLLRCFRIHCLRLRRGPTPGACRYFFTARGDPTPARFARAFALARAAGASLTLAAVIRGHIPLSQHSVARSPAQSAFIGL